MSALTCLPSKAAKYWITANYGDNGVRLKRITVFDLSPLECFRRDDMRRRIADDAVRAWVAYDGLTNAAESWSTFRRLTALWQACEEA